MPNINRERARFSSFGALGECTGRIYTRAAEHIFLHDVNVSLLRAKAILHYVFWVPRDFVRVAFSVRSLMRYYDRYFLRG